MANSTYVLTFQTPLTIATYPVKDTTMPFEEIRALRNFIQRIESGALAASFTAQTSVDPPVYATQVLTLTYSSITTEDTFVVAGVTFEAVTGTPSSSDEFKKQTDATVTAANLCTVVNAHTTANKLVVASHVLGVVTFTALAAGAVGNFLTLVGSTGMVATGAVFTGGTGGCETVPVLYHKGV